MITHSIILTYQSNWPDQLPLVEFTMNSAINQSTRYAPFELNYGWMPKLIGGLDFESPREGVNNLSRTFLMFSTRPSISWLLNEHVRPSRQIGTTRRDKNSRWGI
jgi:hypothetical protein